MTYDLTKISLGANEGDWVVSGSGSDIWVSPQS